MLTYLMNVCLSLYLTCWPTCRLFAVCFQQICVIGQVMSVCVPEACVGAAGWLILHWGRGREPGLVTTHLQHGSQHFFIIYATEVCCVYGCSSLKTHQNSVVTQTEGKMIVIITVTVYQRYLFRSLILVRQTAAEASLAAHCCFTVGLLFTIRVQEARRAARVGSFASNPSRQTQ